MTDKDKIEIWLKGVGLALTAFGLVWGLVEFSDLVKQRKVTATIGYVNRFNNDQLLKARLELSTAWRSYRPAMERLRQTRVTPDDYQHRHRQLLFTVLRPGVKESAELEEDVSLVVAFFEELQICVQHGLCDKAAAKSFFAQEIQAFHCLYGPYIRWVSENYSARYGAGLPLLRRSFGNLSTKCY